MAWVGSIQLKTTTLILLLIRVHHCYGKYCSYLNGRTSDNKDPCTELEHCFFNIDQTGQCPGNRCEPGWMGPGCQYVNLALNPLNMDIVFDGDMATHRSISAATLNLNGTFIVSAFIIHTRWFNGSLIVRDGHQNVLLRKSVQEVSPTIVLPHPVLTDILNMQFRNSIDIKEIEVFGGKDVALWKPTNQSSTYSERILNKRVDFTSDKAVDGSGDGNFDNLSCTHTAASQSKRPSWNVNLGEAYSIIAIKIASRKDNQYRINGFNLFGTAENGSKLLIYSDQPPYWNRGEIVLDSNRMLDIPVSVITIEGPHDNEKILTLCEVFVYACIPTSAEGTDQCRSFCPKNCQAEYSCKNGCPVCQDGWMGVYCENPITCQPPVSTEAPHILTDKQKYNYNETIIFSCHEGFDLLGTAERICTENGALQPPLPRCTAITCQPPVSSDAPHIITDKQKYNYNETIIFSCPEGFDLQGKADRICTENGALQPPLPRCSALGKQESPSFTVGFFSGGAVGIVVISSVIFVIFFLRRRLCQQKKKENAWYNGGNHQIDDNGHEYSGIEYQSSDRENQNPNVTEPPVSVSEGHYTETKFDSDDKDHHYTKLNEIKMNQLTEETADRPVQL